MVYFLPCSTARRYTRSAQILNITNQANASSVKGHSGIDRRSIIYFPHRQIIRRYSQRSINDV